MAYTTGSTDKTYQTTAQALRTPVVEGAPPRKMLIIAEEPRIAEEPGLGHPSAGRVLVVILAGAAFGLLAGILASIGGPARDNPAMIVVAAWGCGLGSLAGLIAEIVRQAFFVNPGPYTHYIVAASAFRIERVDEDNSTVERLPQKVMPMQREERDELI